LSRGYVLNASLQLTDDRITEHMSSINVLFILFLGEEATSLHLYKGSPFRTRLPCSSIFVFV